MKAVINASSYAFRLHRPVLEDLWGKHPELFDEPMTPEDFAWLGGTRTVTEMFDWAVERAGQVHFLTLDSPALRSLPSLVARVEAGEDLGLGLKVVEVPDGIEWYVYVEEDGTECIVRNDACLASAK